MEMDMEWKKIRPDIDAPEVNVVIHGRPGPQARSYNRPRAAEIAVIIPDERSSVIAANPRDIVVRKRGGGLQPGLFGSKVVRIWHNLRNC
jgi:hypothetical protein